MILVLFYETVSSKATRCKLWASSAGCRSGKDLEVCRTISGWSTGCIVKLLGIIHSVVTGVSHIQSQDKAERLNHPDDF